MRQALPERLPRQLTEEHFVTIKISPQYVYKLVSGHRSIEFRECFMTDAFIVCCTCANAVEAKRIAKALVEERLAACANIFPSICSIYRWEGKVESAEEWLLFIK